MGPGRGSAAGSLVSHCLDITEVDPLAYSLLFERFLNPERVSMPDIDIDFSVKGRARVMRYVKTSTARSRSPRSSRSARCCRATPLAMPLELLGLDYGAGDRLAKLIPSR